MSDLANALKMLANSISGGTTESVGNSGGSNSAASNEEVSIFERKSNENVDFDYSSMDDEEFFWWQERLEEKKQENIEQQTVLMEGVENSAETVSSVSKTEEVTEIAEELVVEAPKAVKIAKAYSVFANISEAKEEAEVKVEKAPRKAFTLFPNL